MQYMEHMCKGLNMYSLNRDCVYDVKDGDGMKDGKSRSTKSPSGGDALSFFE